MCDQDQLNRWARGELSRRRFGALGGAAMLTACAPVMSGGKGAGLTERAVTWSAPAGAGAGTADGFLVHPAGRRSPAVILWPDIAGVREAKRQMARRLAAEGYAVLVANPYYRDVAGEQFADFAAFVAGGGFAKVKPWRDKLTAEAIRADARAASDFLDGQDGVDTGRGIGSQGYCMGGPFALWTAAALPRGRAAASFHGGGLVRDDADSPHRTIARRTGYLLAISQDDDAKAPRDKEVLRARLAETGASGTVEVFAADHGWTVPDAPAYNQVEAERAWAALLALYARAL